MERDDNSFVYDGSKVELREGSRSTELIMNGITCVLVCMCTCFEGDSPSDASDIGAAGVIT